ncbi:MAG TPA: leucine-rich repeat protein, partial [Clostridia bacterium]|nr:leucine-rich repeat protein [Clostridia bacterium]
MNKKFLTILIVMICMLASIIVIDAMMVPTAAIWVDSGSASGTAQNITSNWNANQKYMLFKIVLSDGSMNDIETTTPLLQYDVVHGRLELISDPAIYVSNMAFSGYTGTLSEVNIPSTKTITVDGEDYAIPVTEVTNTAFSTSSNMVRSIIFPSSIIKIAPSTCASMSVLESVTIYSENSASYNLNIGSSAFMSCSALQTVSFIGDWNTASTINISRYAFMACTSLESMWFHSTTTKTPTFGTNALFRTSANFKAYMLVTNRAAYTTAVGATKCVGFYDAPTSGTDLTVNNTLTW